MIAIARSAPEGAEIVAIDPHAGNDRGPPQEIEGFEDEAAVDSKVFLTNLERAGVRDRVTYVRKFSHDALDDVPGPSTSCTSTAPTATSRRATTSPPGAPRWSTAGRSWCTTRSRRSG